MSTSQSYGPNQAEPTPNERTDAQNPQTAPMPDERVSISSDEYGAQTTLLELIDEFFMLSGGTVGPIEVLNKLLYHWLTTPATDLQYASNDVLLEKAFRLVGFLADLHQKNEGVFYFRELSKEKEVSREA